MRGFASYPDHRPSIPSRRPLGVCPTLREVLSRTARWAVSRLLPCLLVGWLATPAFAQLEYEDDHLQLELVPGQSIEDVNADYGTTSTDEAGPLHLLQVPEGSTVWGVLEEMMGDPRIVWSELSYLNQTPEALRAMVVGVVGGTIEDYEDQDVYGRLHLGTLHQYATGEGVIIAVLDTGVNGDHPALLGHVLPGYDFVDDDDDASDTANGIDDDVDGLVDEGAGHGTMVAGIAHLAAPGAKILPVRVVNDEGTGLTFDVVKGILFAIEQNADILNLSLGLHTPCEALSRGMDLASDAGMIIVAAAGNTSAENPPFFPASLPGVHGVAALDSSDVKADFSSFHPSVSVSGPGVGIRAPFLDDGWAIGAGTSFAAPFVSGQAAIIAGVTPALTKTEADGIVRDGVVDVYQIPENFPFYGKLGPGRIDGIETWNSLRSLTDVVPGTGPESPGATGDGPRVVVMPNPSPVASDVVLSLRLDGPPASAISSNRQPWTVMDVNGRLVRSLEPQAVGKAGWTVVWNGRDATGRLLPSGLYFVRGGAGVLPTRVLRIQR